MDNMAWTKDCCARHLGYWAAWPEWLNQAVADLKAGLYKSSRTYTGVAGLAITCGPRDSTISGQPSAIVNDRKSYANDTGLAVIPIMGPLVKGGGKNDEVDSLQVRRAVRAAARDEDVGAIMLLIDSPGGTVAGTDELAADVFEARNRKPVYAHIDDLGASAAYWIASQAQRITASPTSLVGSIGTIVTVEDTSGMAKAEGIQVHTISTGAYKGAFTPGTEITEEQIAYLERTVNALNDHFLSAVSKGRNVSPKTVEGWADGRVWIAGEAKEMGMIDGVMRYDRAIETARKAIPRRSAKNQISQAEISHQLAQEIDKEFKTHKI